MQPDSRRALGSGELREEARAAKHETAKQAHSKQPGPLKLLHLMRSCDPEKKPDFILLIPGSQGASPTHSFFRGGGGETDGEFHFHFGTRNCEAGGERQRLSDGNGACEPGTF